MLVVQKTTVSSNLTVSASFFNSMEEIEKKFKCPYCFERISMILDMSVDGTQTYIEDCEVCCRPIQITYSVEEHKLLEFYSQGT